jgi:hypothetical protein
MKRLTRLVPFILTVAMAVSLTCASGSKAASFSFTGNFTRDDNVRLFNFSLLNDASVSISTSSYQAGGFDPTLTLFDAQGVFIDQNQDLSPTNFDASMTDSLLAGSYIVALTQYDNFPVADFTNNKLLFDGFTQQGAGNFTGPEFLGAPGSFINIDGLQRTAFWAMDFQGVDSASMPAAPVPEPSTFLLLTAGLVGIAVLLNGKKRQTSTV